MAKASLETTDIFRGAFYLCMGGDLSSIKFRKSGRQIATFIFTGADLHRHDSAYVTGRALVNPVQFRQALNHLRDILFEKLRKHDPASHECYAKTEERYENDRKRNYRAGQAY